MTKTEKQENKPACPVLPKGNKTLFSSNQALFLDSMYIQYSDVDTLFNGSIK